uniref:NADH dehydrogenase subunit 6 n=1 Tax=Metacrangonyx remyi TaxID=931576 RepID=K7ZVU2_9CRUS|nr:NADH dehydrogenase subunit 6 [Metacrangonyx remyi]CCI69569.1 NADH dehydrogenase subunit 6 [Metacrangonyx remyi]
MHLSFFLFFSYILLIFFFSSHPLFMSIMITLQTILIGLIIYYFSVISWFSYLLFMLFLSGMMIILIYVSSLASNNMMKYLIFDFKSIFIFLMLYALMSLYHSKVYILCDSFIHFSNLSYTVTMFMKVYAKETYALTMLLICYLLLVLIMVVKNSSFSKGPLRSNK